MGNNVDVTIRGRNEAGAAIAAAQRQISALRAVVSQLAAGFGVGLGAGVFQQIASGIAGAVRSGIAYNAVLETNTVAFKTLLGTATAATERMQQLAQFASATPFELPEIVAASRVLQSLTEGALASGDGLRLIGDAAAAAGRSFQETAMWVGRLYSGLKSGTPIGEATLRLLEMGLISGETKTRLDQLAESGEATGNAMQIVEGTLGKFQGAMNAASVTVTGLGSTFRDMVKTDLASAMAGITESLRGVMKTVLEARGLIRTVQQMRDDSRGASIKAYRGELEAVQNPAQLEALVRRIEEERRKYADSIAQWGQAIGQMSPAARTGLVQPPEIASQMEQLRKLDEILEEARSAQVVEMAQSGGSGAPPAFGPGTVAGEAAWNAAVEEARREAEFRLQVEQETGLAIQDQIQAQKDLNREKQRSVDMAAEEERLRQQRAFEGSYVGGTATRFNQFQESAAVDDQAGIGGGMIAGVQQSMMQLGTTAQQVGTFVQSSIGGALEGISSSVEGLIRGTMTWAQAFRNVGSAILSSVVTAFAQMIAQMIVSFLLQAVFGRMAKKEASSIGAAWHAAAVSASIATEGTAAGVGLAAFLTAQSAGVAAATGMQSGFLAGGYTGDGPADQIAGVVHRGEYVIPAAAVSQLGIGNLEALTAGTGSSRGTDVARRSSWEPRSIRIYNLVDRSELRALHRDDLDSYVSAMLGRFA